MKEFFTNKKTLFVFSDPAGAKAILAFIYLNRHLLKSYTVVSDRIYDFYSMFEIKVNAWQEKSTEEWIREIQPDILLTATSLPEKIELSFIEEAAKHDIPSVSFVDHWINMASRFKRNEAFILPGTIWVIDEKAKAKGIDEKLPENKLVVAGNPYYTFLQQWKPQISREELLQRIGLNEHDHYLLYAPEPLSVFGLDEKYGFNELDGLKDLMDILQDEELKLVVKLHPNQNAEIFKGYKDEIAIRFAHQENINNLIYYAEAVVGFFSNSLIEAACLGRKVIRNLTRLKIPPWNPLGNPAGMTNCFDKTSLSRSIKK